MNKEFTLYPEALALKELGFDEPCFGCYFHNNKNLVEYNPDGIPFNHNNRNSRISSPTFSQAFRFFREKYNLRGFIGFRPNVKQFDCHVYDMSLSGKEYAKQRTMEEFNKDPKVGTYEEAELACLRKLIVIAKPHMTVSFHQIPPPPPPPPSRFLKEGKEPPKPKQK